MFRASSLPFAVYRGIEQVQQKLSIEKFYQKYRILGKQCPYILNIGIYNNEPKITLTMLRVEQLIENNTLKIKIPSIVEAIDT